jgi:vacuolar-type H+-ATPase subunit I/STV1
VVPEFHEYGRHRLHQRCRAADEEVHSDPKQEATPWEETIAECSRLSSAYQDQQAAGLMTPEELASKLAKLEETRSVVAAELEALEAAREERLRELEADRDSPLASYAETVPEALDELSGEERMRVYRMLQLEVRPDPEGYEVSGTLCNRTPTGRCRSRCSSGSRACGPCRFGARAR